MSNSFLKRYLYILGSESGVLVLGFLITPLLTRTLGASLYGDYAFMLSIVSIVMIPVSAGIFDGTRKFLSESDDENRTSQIFGLYGQLAFLLACLGSGFVLMAVWTGIVEKILGKEFEIYFVLVSAIIFSRQILTLLRGCLMGFGEERYSEPLKILQKVLFGTIGVFLAYVGFGVTGVLIGYLISSVLVSLLSIYPVKHHLSEWRILFRIRTMRSKSEILKFNTLSTVLVFLTATLYHVDILLLRPIAGGTQTGYYKAALIIAELLWFVPNTVQTILLQTTSEMWSQDQSDVINDMSSRITRYTLLLTTIMAIGIGALAQTFLPLYFGEEFSAAIGPLLLLLPGTIGFAIARPLFAIGQGKGELRILVISTTVASVLNIGLNLLLIPRYGTHGAAGATSVSYASMMLLHVWSARQMGLNPLSDLRVSRVVLTVIISTPPIFILARKLPSILSIFLVPPIGLVLYLGLAVLFRAIDLKEVRDIVSKIRYM